MKKIVTHGAFFLTLVLAAASLPAFAQEGGRKSGNIQKYNLKPMVYWGFGGGANLIRFMDEDELCEENLDGTREDCISVPVGGGVILFGGIRPHPVVGLDLSWDSFLHGRSEAYSHATIQSLRLDLKIFFLPGFNVEPYLQVGGGLYWFGDEYSWTRGGGGYQAGAGLDIVLLPGFSTGLQCLYRGIYFWKREGSGGYFTPTYTSNLEITLNIAFRYYIL